MEWRIFLPKGEEPVDVWSLLGVRHFRLRSEERKDTYIACTESVGLKIRGGKYYEVKVRSGKAPSGAEAWSKVSWQNHKFLTAHSLLQLVHKQLHVGGDVQAIQQAFRKELLIQQYSPGDCSH